MANKPIIGIAGRKRHGKNTVADILVAERGFTIVSLAEPLYEMLYRLNPQVGNSTVQAIVDAHGWDQAKDWHPEIRRLLQVLGTECVREVIGEYTWANHWAKRARKPARVVCPDVRFPSDAYKIASVGGVVIEVVRPGYQDPDHVGTKHRGEQGLPAGLIHSTIHNVENDLDGLRAAVLGATAGLL